MKKILIASAFLVGTTALAMAQSNTGGGASTISPGHEMQSQSGSGNTSRGASEYSPGDRMNDSKGTVGESREMSGDRMHDENAKDKY